MVSDENKENRKRRFDNVREEQSHQSSPNKRANLDEQNPEYDGSFPLDEVENLRLVRNI